MPFVRTMEIIIVGRRGNTRPQYPRVIFFSRFTSSLPGQQGIKKFMPWQLLYTFYQKADENVNMGLLGITVWRRIIRYFWYPRRVM